MADGRLLEDLVPPLLLRALRRGARALARRSAAPGRERGPDYYDRTFRDHRHWCDHYTRSRYYPVWTVIVDRLLHQGVESVLDLGCGPGQLACLLRDRGLARYLGVDFSPARLAQAERVCPQLEFVLADLRHSDLPRSRSYDAAVATELLEHLEWDLELLGRLHPGVLFLGTVPDFPDPAHVRCFSGPEEVRRRYRDALADLSVDTLTLDPEGQRLFLLQGRVSDPDRRRRW